jgi:hypothetical protein
MRLGFVEGGMLLLMMMMMMLRLLLMMWRSEQAEFVLGMLLWWEVGCGLEVVVVGSGFFPVGLLFLVVGVGELVVRFALFDAGFRLGMLVMVWFGFFPASL